MSQGTLENLIIFEELGKSLLQPLKRNAFGVFIFFVPTLRNDFQ